MLSCLKTVATYALVGCAIVTGTVIVVVVAYGIGAAIADALDHKLLAPFIFIALIGIAGGTAFGVCECIEKRKRRAIRERASA